MRAAFVVSRTRAFFSMTTDLFEVVIESHPGFHGLTRTNQ
jgi:hypothetical protein